jgi:type VI secretion system protein ImpK
MTRQGAEEGKRLADLYSELFILGAHLRNARELGDIDGLRIRISDMIRSAEREGKVLGVSDETLQRARYAMAAFLDEMILSSSAPNRDQWSAQPLQYEFFKEHVAGVEFFNRLDAIRRGMPASKDLLEVYYLCLVFGFEGQYKLHGREKLKDMVEGIAREFQSRQGEIPPLSPHCKRPDELMELVKSGLPSWVVVVSCVAVVFFFYLVLSFLMSHEANGVAQEIKQFMEVNR